MINEHLSPNRISLPQRHLLASPQLGHLVNSAQTEVISLVKKGHEMRISVQFKQIFYSEMLDKYRPRSPTVM